jgi:4-hydroxybenzoate polyprenyltransferase
MKKAIFSESRKFLSLVKFSHTIFALPFAFIGFFSAVFFTEHTFSFTLLVLVILCMVLARNAAMAFNRYIDRYYDKTNPRTTAREIPSNIIRPKQAIGFAIINSVLFIFTTYFINELCFYLSPVALLIILGYSYTKRFTILCHLILGLGLALAPTGAYLAVTGEFGLIALLYSGAVLFWVSGFDVIYALQDFLFDSENKLKSIPVYFGKRKALYISTIFHLISASFIILAGLLENLGIIYWLGSIVFIGLLFYQHLIIKPNDLKKLNLAFFTTNGIASLAFALFFIAEMYLPL